VKPVHDCRGEHRIRLRRTRRLSPEEDAIIIAGEGDDDDIDETLPADLWYRTRPRSTGG